MHPSIKRRVDGVAALHVRSQIATADLYALIGKEQPVQKIRFQTKTAGKAYHIVELATGKVKGFRWTWKEASNFAQALESRADGVKVTLSGGAPMPDPRDSMIANLNEQLDAFFGAGKSVQVIPSGVSADAPFFGTSRTR